MIQGAAAVATCNRNPVRANRVFIKLTMTLYCDIVANMRNRSLGASACLRRYAPFAVTAENSDRTADATAVLAFAKPFGGPGFPPEKAMSAGDKLPQKQQKQREVHCAVGFVQLMNAI